ncbi:family 20 glycosylhydrolase [bacterium]|nr:family 20 glycosylhydrolase [bacterium]
MIKNMFLVTVLTAAAAFFLSCGAPANSQLDIIPRPVSEKILAGEFLITSDFKIVLEDENEAVRRVADHLAACLEKSTGNHPDIIVGAGGFNTLLLQAGVSGIEPEGYSLRVNPDGVVLKAADAAGLFYGVQTLLQLLPAPIYRPRPSAEAVSWSVPCVVIEDAPRYAYRGLHLDVCRHYFPVSFIKKYLDYMAMHKLNTFHWHLTEDQGWRIEIKKYPKLTAISAYRNETLVGHYSDTPRRYDRTRYGGYYTQDDIRDIVRYAADRFITVIPEIEMPGHSVAALAAYPELSCTGGPFEVRTIWGISKDIYCAGKEETFTFLENVLLEVMDLFPSTYIHIGGDEAPKDRWEACPDCQKRIADEGLHNEHELQSYFIRRIERFLNEHGRQLIGWDEILEGGLAPGATVMSWRGMNGGIAAARQNHDVIMTPTTYCYFDYAQADRAIEPLAIGGFLPLKKVYEFEPTPADSLTEEQQAHIIGGQANVWTEYIASEDYCEYMLMPRVSALAEAVWTWKQLRDWDDFSHRIQKQYQRYMYMDANFRIPTPVIADTVQVRAGGAVTIDNPAGFGIIRYTVDGSEPSVSSPVFSDSLVFESPGVLRSRLFLPTGRGSSIISTVVEVK